MVCYDVSQAQLVSAIRLALAPEAAPGLQTTGCTLVACFLEAGLDGGDPVVVRRMMNLLLRPLQDWEKTQVYETFICPPCQRSHSESANDFVHL
jgi:hypothetical protein